MLAKVSGSALLFSLLASAVALAGGCSSKSNAADGRLCTPGAYVYCRCSDRSEGTKLCHDDGQVFDPCVCDGSPLVGTDEDAGVTWSEDAAVIPIDTGPPPDAAAPAAIDPLCAGRLGVLAGAGGDLDLDAVLAVYTGNNVFSVSGSHGPGLRSNATIVAVNGSLVGVYLSRYSLIASTKLGASWSGPVSIGNANGDSAPSFTVMASGQGKLLYRGVDGTFYVGTYAAGWDQATTPAESAADVADAGPAGRSAPALAASGTSLVYGFTTDATPGALMRATWSGSGSFGTASRITSASTFYSAPAITAMNGGTKDMLMVYTGSDFALHATTREASNKAWNTAMLVDDAAQPSDAPAVAPLPNGGALAVWREANGRARFSVYDPALAKPWGAPADLVAGANPQVASTPSVAVGGCGGDVVLAYAEAGAGVSVMHWRSGAWTTPTKVPGTDGVAWVGVGELP